MGDKGGRTELDALQEDHESESPSRTAVLILSPSRCFRGPQDSLYPSSSRGSAATLPTSSGECGLFRCDELRKRLPCVGRQRCWSIRRRREG